MQEVRHRNGSKQPKKKPFYNVVYLHMVKEQKSGKNANINKSESTKSGGSASENQSASELDFIPHIYAEDGTRPFHRQNTEPCLFQWNQVCVQNMFCLFFDKSITLKIHM